MTNPVKLLCEVDGMMRRRESFKHTHTGRKDPWSSRGGEPRQAEARCPGRWLRQLLPDHREGALQKAPWWAQREGQRLLCCRLCVWKSPQEPAPGTFLFQMALHTKTEWIRRI